MTDAPQATLAQRSAPPSALRWTVPLAALCLLSMGGGCATTATERLGLPPLQTVEHVDLHRYTGTWYEIASYPQRFQEGCTGTTATYTLKDDGEIHVLNRCHLDSLSGELDSAEGRARVVDAKTGAKLEVTFFWPFWGDYWIIDLGKAYDYAVVGHPGRDYLWILSREPTMAKSVYDGILDRLRAQGYELDRLQRTVQPSASRTRPLTLTTPLPEDLQHGRIRRVAARSGAGD